MARSRKYPVELLVFELRRTNEILKAASLFFAGELDPQN
jgi:hypothetical protein